MRSADGSLYDCVVRGKRVDLACGDRVVFGRLGERDAAIGDGVVESIESRDTLIQRSTHHRRKLIAANVTQLIAIVAAEPTFSDEFLARALILAEHQGIPALLVFNKIDLPAAAQERTRLRPFEASGYPVIELSAKRDISALAARLRGHTSLFIGQSGMGKSTLLNALVPHAHAATQEISRYLDTGRHTTTHARLYSIDATTAIIDAPGMQEVGLAHLSIREIEHALPERRPWLGRCRFTDCRHVSEPGCALKQAVEQGQLDRERFAVAQRIIASEVRAVGH